MGKSTKGSKTKTNLETLVSNAKPRHENTEEGNDTKRVLETSGAVQQQQTQNQSQPPAEPAASEGNPKPLTQSLNNPMKGKNISGRSWKVHPQKRASSLTKTKFNNQSKSWEKRQAEKLARQEMLELQKQMKEETRQSAIQKKERRLENEKRRAENEFKNIQQSIQTLNANKVGYTLKAMSKKQLRQIKKSRMNTKTGVVEYVPAYAK